MNKILYYMRFTLFIPFLICLFLLIDKILCIKIFGSIFLILTLIYSILIILSVLSKKKVYIDNFSFNFLNMGIYIYFFIIFYFAYTTSRLEVLNNFAYYRDNFLILYILIGFQIGYIIYLNAEEK